MAIPAALPILVALLATVTRGVTGFGDGITYQVLWSAASLYLYAHKPADASVSQSEWERTVYAKGVLYSTLAQSVSMPLQVWLARRELHALWGYAVVMIAAGAPCVALGAQLLLTGDISGVRILVGVFFLIFSVVQGSGAALKHLKKKQAVRRREEAASTAVEAEAVAGPASPTAAAVAAAEPAPIAATSVSSTEGLLPDAAAAAVVDVTPLDVHPAAQRVPPPASPPVDDAGEPVPRGHPDHLLCLPLQPLATAPWWAPPRRTLALLTLAATATGFLSGVTGAGGPPLMAAYAVLVVPKDRLRGMACVAVGLMVVRLAMFTSSTGSVFSWEEEGWTYVGIGVAAWLGVAIGDRLRAFVDTVTIVHILLGLVFTSSGLTLGALRKPAVGVGYLALLATWLSAFFYLRAHPALLARLTRRRGGGAASVTVAAAGAVPAGAASADSAAPAPVALQRG